MSACAIPQRGWGPFAGHDAVGHERSLSGATMFGITSTPDVSTVPKRPKHGWMRTFTVQEYTVMTVEVRALMGQALPV